MPEQTTPIPVGPFETEEAARTHPAVRAIYEASRSNPRTGGLGEGNHRLLEEACTAAGVELGHYDHRILLWLADWEPQMCAVIAGLITRAVSVDVDRKEPQPARPFALPGDVRDDNFAITAFAAYRGWEDAQQAVAAFRMLTEDERVNWRAAADGVRILGDLFAGPLAAQASADA